MTDSHDLLDQLLVLPPSEFIAARNQLAAGLKKTDATRSAALKALPKPSPSVWATNQVARKTPRKIAAFLEASDALERAQTGRGGSDESRRAYQSALATQREALDQVVSAAREVLSQQGLPANRAVLERVTNDLRWAALAREARKELEAGRLTRDLEPPDFSALVDRIPIVPAQPRVTREEKPAAKKTSPESAAPADEPLDPRRMQALRNRHTHAAENVAAAREQLARTRATLEEAEKDVAAMRRELAAAEKKATMAAKAHDVAEGTLGRQISQLEELETALKRAEK